ncbi:MAG TPA: acyl carrier protein [Lachnospiraceae bacterium]|nr:acyl carrier protein [Lachnospiraceae bacterium]
MLERVKEIIVEILAADDIDITEETSLKDDLGADSLDLFELITAFQDEYGVEIPEEELESIQTVGDIIEFMKSKGVEG